MRKNGFLHCTLPRGIVPTMGSAAALFVSAFLLLPLLAMPPFDSMAAVAATATMIKMKVASATAVLAWHQSGGSGGRSVAVATALAWRRWWQHGGGGSKAVAVAAAR